jgi:hemerythrin-like metal-binding protein
MDSKFYLGIPEIDAQHEEIQRIVAALQEVIASKSQRYMVGPAMKRLNQLLVSHFAAEEALMGMVAYSDLHKHKKMHSKLLQLLDDYFRNPPASSEYDSLGKVIGDKVLGHVMEHDLQMTGMVRDYLRSFQSAPKETRTR